MAQAVHTNYIRLIDYNYLEKPKTYKTYRLNPYQNTLYQPPMLPESERTYIQGQTWTI